MKAVFDTRSDTKYDDDIVRRYHFPNRYLPEARRAIGDWIVYREPRRGGGRQGYVAVARVTRIAADPSDPSSSYAHLADYLAFDVVVPLHRKGRYYETRLAAVKNPSRIGVALQGRSIRTISDEEFGAITHAGLAVTLDPANAHGLGEVAGSRIDAELARWIETNPDERERRIAQILVNRRFRDAAFRTTVVSAYEERCAVTRLRIVNGGGKAEVEAAHIWPVSEGGPDVIQNGLALSATCHWLFDRHLISLTDEYGLLVSHNRVPGELRTLFEMQRDRIHLPADERLWPKREYVARHRERFAGHRPESDSAT